GSVQWVWKESLGTVGGTVAWQGSAFDPQGWIILDSNMNLEVVTNSGGETGTTQPTWQTAIGATTSDGTEFWVNVGPFDSFYMVVANGASGIIVDNIVSSGTLGGGSQVYFSPLSLGFSSCGAGSGCAVQASQAALK